MQDTQIHNTEQNFTSWKIGFVVIMSFVLVSWVKQDALSQYWQQSYQNVKAWDFLANHMPNWQQGNAIANYFNSEKMFDNIAHFNTDVNHYANQIAYHDFLKEQERLEKQRLAHIQAQKIKRQQQLLEAQQQAHAKKQLEKMVYLGNDQKVFFVGDSLMQGVAPWVMRELQNDYQIKSIDLSKQSTGLSYSKFFDWPANIEKTLANNPDIGVMVVFLGPNDAWDVPDPDNRAKVVKFGTPRWQEVYTGHIQRILTTTAKNNVQVLWVTPPNMKKPKLNDGMAELSRIIHEAIRPEQGVVIDSKGILSPNGNFADSMKLNGKIVKVRTADGIHFTPDGQKLVAKQVLSHFKIS